MNNLPFHVPGFHQSSNFTLSVPGSVGVPNTIALLVLSLACSWNSKLQILKDRARHGPILSSREYSYHTVSVPFHPRKIVTHLPRCLDTMLKHSKRQQPDYLSSEHLCPLPRDSHSVVPAESLSSERQYTLFHIYSRKCNVLSWCNLGDSYTRLPTPKPVPSFSPGAHVPAQL